MEKNNDIDNKYEITNIVGYRFKKKVYRIRALKDFGDVKKGDLGGFVSSYDNLSQEDNCWIYDDAAVMNNAILEDNSTIHNRVIVCHDSIVRCNSKISKSCRIYDSTKITNSTISGKSVLRNINIVGSMINGVILSYKGKVWIEYSTIRGSLLLSESLIFNSKIISDRASIYQDSVIMRSNIRLLNGSDIYSSWVYEYSNIYANLKLHNSKIYRSDIIGDIDNMIKIVNKRVEMGYITCTEDIISLSVDMNTIGFDTFNYYPSINCRNTGNIKLTISTHLTYYDNINDVIKSIGEHMGTSAPAYFVKTLRNFDKLAKEYFNVTE